MSIDYSNQPDYFKINGVSSATLNVWCDTPPVPPMAQRRYETYDSGFDEDSTVPDDSYADINYTLTFYTFDTTDYNNTDIYNFFVNAKTLQISRLLGYFYKIRKVVSVEPAGSHNGKKIKYVARLVLAPFKYNTDNPMTSIAASTTVNNNGNRFSKPLFRMTGSAIALTCNGQSLNITLSENKTIIIDSERLVVYEESSGTIILNAISGLYPMLNVGTNSIEITGAWNISVQKNERWY